MITKLYNIKDIEVIMNLFNKKKGQAAIEFLMTYGWMLLVVLIVGALIFSFVDFGALLPNKIDISSTTMRAIVGDSSAQDDPNPALTTGTVIIAFKYNGVQPVEFDITKQSITYNYGDTPCADVAKIYNKDINLAADGTVALGDTIRFRNGHSGYIEFQNCPDFNQVDVIEGDILFSYESTQTGAQTPVYGTLRLTK